MAISLNIGEYKNKLMREIINAPNIVEAIGSQSEEYDPEAPESLIYTNIFPYLRVPDVQTVAQSYILLSVDNHSPSSNNEYFCNMSIYIKILVHQKVMKMKGKSITRVDYLAEEIERLLVGQTKFGFGALELTFNREDIYKEIFPYRELTFRTLDARSITQKNFGVR